MREFSAWRRKSTKRKFSPYLIVEIADCEIAFDGYNEVWAFLDALFPDDKLPRNAVNAAMKGDFFFENGRPFTREVESFLNESEISYFNITTEYRGEVNHPLFLNEHGILPKYSGFFVTEVESIEKSREIRDKKTEELTTLPDFSYHSLLPFKDSDGTRLVHTLVYGQQPHLVFVQRVDNAIATFGLHSRGPYGDIRLERWLVDTDIEVIEKNIPRLLKKLRDDERVYTDFTETNALYSIERDEIECLRAHSFC